MNRKENITDKVDRLYPGLFTQLDRQFADFLCDLSNTRDPEFILSVRLVSRYTSDGNICLDIPSISGSNIFDIFSEASEIGGKILLYYEKEWLNKIRKNPVVGRPGDFKPLILDNSNRLYLYRYWLYENRFAENIKKRLENKCVDIDWDLLKTSLDRLFNSDSDMDQRVASVIAVLKRFCVISGGPGTGKTSTVIKILIMLLEQARSRNEHLRIAIAAPTGKAAARINESIKDAVNLLDGEQSVKQNIPRESFTLHRLLRPIWGSPYFYYNQKNPLPYDMVVVDESSMADLALISKLFDAVPLNARIILLGDKDQLASVEAGAVLGDICGTGIVHGYSNDFLKILKKNLGPDFGKLNIRKIQEEHIPPITDSIVLLNTNYRFSQESGISKLSKSIKAGDSDSVIKILKSGKFNDISFTDKLSEDSFDRFFTEKIISGYSNYLKADDPLKAIEEFRNFTVLCALRKGPFGVEWMNKLAEDILVKNRLISVNTQWYEGRPVMIIRNDYNIRLYNGDIGIIHRDHDNSKIYFYLKSEGTLRKIIPLKLPEHETVYAMTVHKSQGSEFNKVLLLLPDRPGPLLTREMLYTAVTRARDKVEIYGSEFVIRYMINNPTFRISGLRDSLWL